MAPATTNGTEQTNGLSVKWKGSPSERQFPEKDKHSLVLNSFRCLVADIVQQFDGGHPGGAMGMAAMGIALWKYTMKYSPSNPNWFNRDRFVLSNGHCCLFQYLFLHLTGYKSMTKAQLLNYHSKVFNSLCPGHPEREIDGIEVTTGPLGQGIANAVGLAIASTNLAATYNRPGFDVVDSYIYCTVGDACLQEGVALEAFSLAGHWRLKNLIVLYDNNQITCDGSVDLCNTEDINDKLRATGWNIIDVEDANHDVELIVSALDQAKKSDKPTFINCRTIIGIGSAVQGKAEAHGASFGKEDVKSIKKYFGMNPEEHFIIPEEVQQFYAPLPQQGAQLEKEYNDLLTRYAEAHPELAAEFKLRREGKSTQSWEDLIPKTENISTDTTPSRKSGGAVCNPLVEKISNFMVGTADLSPSVSMIYKDKTDFQHPDLRTECGINGNYTGRYLHYGVREHAMVAISNGLAAYNHGTIIPITSTFLVFYMYAAPAVRMSALQRLPTLHIATHDCIGAGEDGPTHQPIALPSFFRALPHTLFFRPADTEETAGAFISALSHFHLPLTTNPTSTSHNNKHNSPNPQSPEEAEPLTSLISLSRHGLTQLHAAHSDHPLPQALTSRAGVQRGGYIVHNPPTPRVTLLSTGSELALTLRVAAKLQSSHGIAARVVSLPCSTLFDAQPSSYRNSILQRREMPHFAIEAYALRGWERYADGGWGMTGFGRSGPGSETYGWFGFEEGNLVSVIRGWIERGEKGGEAMWWLGGWWEAAEGWKFQGE